MHALHKYYLHYVSSIFNISKGNKFIYYLQNIPQRHTYILSSSKYFSFFKFILICNQNVETDYL
jgi:hypothetical protein